MNTNQDFGHAFAYASKNENGRINSMSYSDDVAYSYNAPIARKVRNKAKEVEFILFDSSRYSTTTSKHQGIIKNALYSPIIEVCTTTIPFNSIKEVKAQFTCAVEMTGKYINSRLHKGICQRKILGICNNINMLSSFYRIKSKLPINVKRLLNCESDFQKILDLLTPLWEKKSKRDKADILRLRRQNEKSKKEKLAKEMEKIAKWKAGEVERIYLTQIKESFLRVKDNQVQTSQGITIDMKEALRLIRLIERKKIIGSNVNDLYTITAFDEVLTAGCHTIPKTEINSVINQIKLY